MTLFIELARAELMMRYRNSRFGIIWAVLHPLIYALALTVLFDGVTRINTGNIPYPLFILSSMTLWIYFVSLTTTLSKVLETRKHWLENLPLPLTPIFLAAGAGPLCDFLIGLLVVGLAVLFEYGVHINMFLYVPVAIIMISILGATIGIITAKLSIRFKDIPPIIQYALRIMLYLSPVFYPLVLSGQSSAFSLQWLNPIAGCMALFRFGLFGEGLLPLMNMIPAALFIVTMPFIVRMYLLAKPTNAEATV